MYSRNSFGSYYPVDSCIHRLNPIIKLINFLMIFFIIILTNSVHIHLFMFILVLVMCFLSFVPFRVYFRTFWTLKYIYILIAIICVCFKTPVEVCLMYISKVVILVEYLNILAHTTSPSESIYGIEKFISLFNFLYLPISKFAFKINSILRYIPLYMTVQYKTFKASSSRGVDYKHLSIDKRFKLFFETSANIRRLTREKSKEIRYNSELRLYDVRKYRTNYRTNFIGFYDIFFLLFHLLLIYAYAVEEGIL